jgi:hypothetical protein
MLGSLKLGLAGDHQYINAGLAVALCQSWLRRTGHSEDFNLPESVCSCVLFGNIGCYLYEFMVYRKV